LTSKTMQFSIYDIRSKVFETILEKGRPRATMWVVKVMMAEHGNENEHDGI